MKPKQQKLPRNVWVVGATSFFTDISSEMIHNLLPLFLNNVLGIRTVLIGLIEGLAETLASFLKLFSGWLSDRLRMRKKLAVLGYAVSALAKLGYLFATSWGVVAGARWGDRLGKGIRTAPRDALIADSVPPQQRGFAFGFHRAADTAGAFLGLVIALVVVWSAQSSSLTLQGETFRLLVLIGLLPSFAAVVFLALGARDVGVADIGRPLRISPRGLGKRFFRFLLITAVFELGNSSDAFLVLRAQERGLPIVGILLMLIAFNFVYSQVSLQAGKWADRMDRRRLIALGWGGYAVVYLGMAVAGRASHIALLYVLYGVYYGLTFGTARAYIADIVPAEQRGIAYGTYNALVGLVDLPASLIAGVLWSGLGNWRGWGPSVPFVFGAVCAAAALVLFLLPVAKRQTDS